MDGAVDASPTPQAAVGGVDDGVDLQGGYVGDDDLDPVRHGAPSQRSGRHFRSCTSLGGDIAGQVADFPLEIASMAFPAADAITSQWIRPRPSRRRSTTTSCASTRRWRGRAAPSPPRASGSPPCARRCSRRSRRPRTGRSAPTRCWSGWPPAASGWRRSRSTGRSTPWWRPASCTASRAATPSSPAIPATSSASWCWRARSAARWPRWTVPRCSPPSTRRRRAPRSWRVRPGVRWWRCGACAATAAVRMLAMQGREGLDWALQPPVGGALGREPLGPERAGHDPTCHAHSVHGRPLAPHEPTALISARGLRLARAGRPILIDIDIDISPGEIVTLIGPNGAGKTMLVRSLLGLEPLDSGEVRRRDGLVIGYAPQRFDIDRAIPLTVARFISLGRRGTREEIEHVLAGVGAAALFDRQLSELSGGELQRVVLARALIRSPSLLVLDEPVRGVDYAGEAELYTLIGKLRTERGFGVLLVSHDLHVVMAQSDRVICLNRHVCCSGVPQSVAQHPEYARLFGPTAARALGLYHHHHDHRHDLTGEPRPPAAADRPERGSGSGG